MTGPDPIEARFRRLLAWYPDRWRQQHGEVLLATMLDDAERTGRTQPTSAERRSAAVHGLATRLDTRLALGAAIVGLAVSVLVGILSYLPVWISASWPIAFVSASIGPAFVFLAVVALARDRGVLLDGRALLVAVLAVLAVMLGGLASLSWALGFDAADAGRPVTGLAAGWLPLVSAGLILGALAIALFLHAVFTRTGMHRLGSGVLSGLVGIIAAPIVGYALLTPVSVAVLAVVVLILAARPRRASRRPLAAPDYGPAARGARDTPVSPSRAGLGDARLLVGIAGVAGAVGVAWALTGSLWSPFGGDSTETMRQGIAILCASTLPLLAGWAHLASLRSSARLLNLWGPAAVGASGFVVLAVEYVLGSGSGNITAGLVTSSALVGAAVGWWTGASVRLAVLPRVLIGAAAAVTYTVFIGIFFTAMLAFLVPVAAAVLLIVVRPRRERSTIPAGALPTGG